MMHIIPDESDWAVIENALTTYGDQLTESIRGYEDLKATDQPGTPVGVLEEVNHKSLEWARAEDGRVERLWNICQARRGWLPQHDANGRLTQTKHIKVD